MTNNGGCNHTCTNTPGSFYCNCTDGFMLNADKRECSGQYHICCNLQILKCFICSQFLTFWETFIRTIIDIKHVINNINIFLQWKEGGKTLFLVLY